ncbi:MAG: hypothetical protein GY859_02015 [Desulfobacterales bacterium]|nr:hypothetical protein [Desulfobacterales bacterium]
MPEIFIELDIEEGRTLFEALAELPFKQVFELIGKINETANKNLAGPAAQTAPSGFGFTRPELELALQALGELPFNRVHSIIAKINTRISIPNEDEP